MDLECIVVLDFHLLESDLVHFDEEVEEAPVGEVQLSHLEICSQ